MNIEDKYSVDKPHFFLDEPRDRRESYLDYRYPPFDSLTKPEFDFLVENQRKIEEIEREIDEELTKLQSVSLHNEEKFPRAEENTEEEDGGKEVYTLRPVDVFMNTNNQATLGQEQETPKEFASKQPWSRHEGPPASKESESLSQQGGLP